jgi:hypothetical protein
MQEDATMLIEMLKALLSRLFPNLRSPDRYRPERHYMRGPGPKSRQRHATDSELNKIEA